MYGLNVQVLLILQRSMMQWLYMTKDGGRNLSWKYEDADSSGLASTTWICSSSPAAFGGSILPEHGCLSVVSVVFSGRGLCD